MIKIIFSIWLILALINLIYEILVKNLDQNLEKAAKDTNYLVSKNIILTFYLIITTLLAPLITVFHTIPSIILDIINLPRLIRYKIIKRRRKKRKLVNG